MRKLLKCVGEHCVERQIYARFYQLFGQKKLPSVAREEFNIIGIG